MNIAGDFGDKRPKIFEQTVHTWTKYILYVVVCSTCTTVNLNSLALTAEEQNWWASSKTLFKSGTNQDALNHIR